MFFNDFLNIKYSETRAEKHRETSQFKINKKI